MLACLGSARAAGKMTSAMIASLMLQFLPRVAQRACRKQEKINRMGAQHREILLPCLHRVLIQMETVEGLRAARAGVEAFVTGKDTACLGDTLSLLAKGLMTMESKSAVAGFMKAVSEELLDLLPRVFPDVFDVCCAPL